MNDNMIKLLSFPAIIIIMNDYYHFPQLFINDYFYINDYITLMIIIIIDDYYHFLQLFISLIIIIIFYNYYHFL